MLKTLTFLKINPSVTVQEWPTSPDQVWRRFDPGPLRNDHFTFNPTNLDLPKMNPSRVTLGSTYINLSSLAKIWPRASEIQLFYLWPQWPDLSKNELVQGNPRVHLHVHSPQQVWVDLQIRPRTWEEWGHKQTDKRAKLLKFYNKSSQQSVKLWIHSPKQIRDLKKSSKYQPNKLTTEHGLIVPFTTWKFSG